MYQDYTPPVKAAEIVNDLLTYVPEKFLVGLDSVVLRNASGLSRREQRGKVRRRGRKVAKAGILGRYHPRGRGQVPWIELYVDRILTFADNAPGWVPRAQELIFANTLYHEIGHHIHYEKRPEHREKEDVADDYATRLTVNFIRKKYRLLLPVILPALKTYRWFRGNEKPSSR